MAQAVVDLIPPFIDAQHADIFDVDLLGQVIPRLSNVQYLIHCRKMRRMVPVFKSVVIVGVRRYWLHTGTFDTIFRSDLDYVIRAVSSGESVDPALYSQLEYLVGSLREIVGDLREDRAAGFTLLPKMVPTDSVFDGIRTIAFSADRGVMAVSTDIDQTIVIEGAVWHDYLGCVWSQGRLFNHKAIVDTDDRQELQKRSAGGILPSYLNPRDFGTPLVSKPVSPSAGKTRRIQEVRCDRVLYDAANPGVLIHSAGIEIDTLEVDWISFSQMPDIKWRTGGRQPWFIWDLLLPRILLGNRLVTSPLNRVQSIIPANRKKVNMTGREKEIYRALMKTIFQTTKFYTDKLKKPSSLMVFDMEHIETVLGKTGWGNHLILSLMPSYQGTMTPLGRVAAGVTRELKINPDLFSDRSRFALTRPPQRYRFMNEANPFSFHLSDEVEISFRREAEYVMRNLRNFQGKDRRETMLKFPSTFASMGSGVLAAFTLALAREHYAITFDSVVGDK